MVVIAAISAATTYPNPSSWRSRNQHVTHAWIKSHFTCSPGAFFLASSGKSFRLKISLVFLLNIKPLNIDEVCENQLCKSQPNGPFRMRGTTGEAEGLQETDTGYRTRSSHNLGIAQYSTKNDTTIQPFAEIHCRRGLKPRDASYQCCHLGDERLRRR